MTTLRKIDRDLSERVSKLLREYRQLSGYTQLEASKVAGLSVTAVAMIERRERSPRLITLVRLLETYNKSLMLLASDLSI